MNFLTVDFEEWFHITGAPKKAIETRSNPDEKRAARYTRCLLEIFKRHQVKATFFILGCVAEENSRLIRQIHEEGHEIASHGYSHRVLMELAPREFRDELVQTKKILKEITGKTPEGYRAPSFSITPETKWAFDILAEEGFLYDSSVFLAPRGEGGYPGKPKKPFDIKTACGKLLKEFPICAGQILGRPIPFSGGGYLRILPYPVIHRMFRYMNRRGLPVVTYIHPRDIDPEQPRLKLPLLKSFKTYTGLRTAESKLNRLLKDFKFQSLGSADER